MKKDYSKEVKELLTKYDKQYIEFGKELAILLRRIKATKEEIYNEIFKCDNLKFTEKQKKDGETRYALFFIYSKKKGRKYVITLRDKLRIVTIFPLGRKTLKRYRKKGLYSNKK